MAGKEQYVQSWRGRKRLGALHELEILALAVSVAGGALFLAVQDYSGERDFQSFWEAAGVAAAAIFAHILIGLLLVMRSWDATPKAHDPGTEERPGFFGAFFWMSGLLAVLAWSALHSLPGGLGFPWTVDFADARHVTLFLVTFAAAFLPLCFGYHLVALEAMNTRKTASYLVDPDGPVGSVTILATLGIVALVGTGAWAAGEQMFEMSGYFGLICMGLVVSAFLSFIVLANLAGFKALIERNPSAQIKASGAAHPGAIISGIDALLVRLLAPLSGATLPGWFMPQAMLLIVMFPLALMGYALPHPLGLVPIAFAMIIVLALGRRWAWVEDDREKALRLQTTKSDKFRIGFANDLRDEALMGYAWLFALVPLALRQIQLEFEIFPQSANDQSLINWFNFFGAELAKGVPIVDWFDIYDVDETPVFEAESAIGRHIIFASRLVIDIVIIAALLQAIGIAQRNSAQKNLFKSGQVDFFDPFMERKILEEAWQAEVNGEPPVKQDWRDFFEDHRRASAELDRGDFRYNPRRLSELSMDFAAPGTASEERIRQVVEWLAYDLVVGSIAKRQDSLVEVYAALLLAEQRDETDAQLKRRQFERFLDDLIADFRATHPDDLNALEYQQLSRLLWQIRTDRQLDVQRNRAFVMLGDKATLDAARVLAGRLIDEPQAAETLIVPAEDAGQWHVKRQGRAPDRALAAEQLVNINVATQSISEEDKSQFARLKKEGARRRLTLAEQREFEMLKRKGAGVAMSPQELETFKELFQRTAALIRNS